jgi:hypothetical protein
MAINQTLQEMYESFAKDKTLKNKDINYISIVGGTKIQDNIFNQRLYHNGNIIVIYDLIPLVNSLFTDYIIDFKYFKNQIIFIGNKELLNKQEVTPSNKYKSGFKYSKSYYHNRLIDYTIINDINAFNDIKSQNKEINNLQNCLVKYKNITSIPMCMFSNIEVFNHIEFYYSFEWVLEENVKLNIKFNKSYFSINLEIKLEKQQISKNKDYVISAVTNKYEKLLNHINHINHINHELLKDKTLKK